MKILVSFFLFLFLKGAFAEEKDIFIYSINDLIGLQVTFTYEDGNQCTYQFFEDKKMLSDCYESPLEYTIYQKGEFFEKGGLIKWNVQGESRRHDYFFEGIVFWDEDKTINTLVSYNGTDFVYDSLSDDIFFTSSFDDIYKEKNPSAVGLTLTDIRDIAGCHAFWAMDNDAPPEDYMVTQEYLSATFETWQEYVKPIQDWFRNCIETEEPEYCASQLEPEAKAIIDEQMYGYRVATQKFPSELLVWRINCSIVPEFFLNK